MTRLKVTFSVRSIIFSQPGDDSAIRFVWGEDTGSALRANLPLVTIEMPNALVVGEEVYFPVILKSGFGERMWSSLEDFEFKLEAWSSAMCDPRASSQEELRCRLFGNQDPIQTDGTYQVNLSIWLNKGDVPLTTGSSHSSRLKKVVGRKIISSENRRESVSSRLDVNIDVEYDGSSNHPYC